jgi:hypothetical protein
LVFHARPAQEYGKLGGYAAEIKENIGIIKALHKDISRSFA